jgi:hypothetical protein
VPGVDNEKAGTVMKFSLPTAFGKKVTLAIGLVDLNLLLFSQIWPLDILMTRIKCGTGFVRPNHLEPGRGCT